MYDSITVETSSTMEDVHDSMTPPAGEELEAANSSFSEATVEDDFYEGLEGNSLDEGEKSEDEKMLDD